MRFVAITLLAVLAVATAAPTAETMYKFLSWARTHNKVSFESSTQATDRSPIAGLRDP